MDEPEETNSESVSPEEAMRQLIQMRLQLGKERFNSIARQMGMPDELLDHVEQAVGLMSGPAGSASSPAPAASGLLDASGRPLGGGPSGLLDATGRPITSQPNLDGRATLNGNGAEDDEDELVGEEGLDEE